MCVQCFTLVEKAVVVLARVYLPRAWQLYAVAVAHLLGFIASSIFRPYAGEGMELQLCCKRVELKISNMEVEDAMDLSSRLATVLTSWVTVLKTSNTISSSTANLLLFPVICGNLAVVAGLQKW